MSYGGSVSRGRLSRAGILVLAGAAGFAVSVAVATGIALGGPTQAATTSAVLQTTTGAEPPPVIAGASLTHKRFRVAAQRTAVATKAPLGTTFRFTLSVPGSMQIDITRSAPGLRSGRTCVAPSARLRRSHARRCRRAISAGTLTRSHELKGPNSVPFSGRLGRRALGPGAYTATLTAHGSGGLSAPTALAFTVVK